jgi:periplasmic protein TonB
MRFVHSNINVKQFYWHVFMDFFMEKHLLSDIGSLLIIKCSLMKNYPVINQSRTLEDIVFEGRNKSYGAYELNKKGKKYLAFAFIISLFGVSTAIAVPLLSSFKNKISGTVLNKEVTVKLISVNPHDQTLKPPPPPPVTVMKNLEKRLVYKVPVVVDVPVENTDFAPADVVMDKNINIPLDIPAQPVYGDGNTGIAEPVETPMSFPEESALFMGGGLEEFSKWVMERITYPEEAINNNIFGKVIIEFCVNSKGEVVDLKLLRTLDPLIDNEALKVISSSPRWTPAKQGGNPVKQRFTIPFTFIMQ